MTETTKSITAPVPPGAEIVEIVKPNKVKADKDCGCGESTSAD